jgi:hypothetical protein
MSYFLRILCRSDSPIGCDDIEQFITDGAYFDSDPHFVRTPPGADADWHRLEVSYEADRRPIVMENTPAGDLLSEELDEIREVATGLAPAAARTITQHLDAVRRIIAIEIDRARLTDDAWEMVDALESFLARHLDGILYAPDDGFYDADLRPIAKLP